MPGVSAAGSSVCDQRFGGQVPTTEGGLKTGLCEFLCALEVLEVCSGPLLISLTVDIETQDLGVLPECRHVWWKERFFLLLL